MTPQLCPYCGRRRTTAKARTCSEHADLVQLDAALAWPVRVVAPPYAATRAASRSGARRSRTTHA